MVYHLLSKRPPHKELGWSFWCAQDQHILPQIEVDFSGKVIITKLQLFNQGYELSKGTLAALRCYFV